MRLRKRGQRALLRAKELVHRQAQSYRSLVLVLTTEERLAATARGKYGPG